LDTLIPPALLEHAAFVPYLPQISQFLALIDSRRPCEGRGQASFGANAESHWVPACAGTTIGCDASQAPHGPLPCTGLIPTFIPPPIRHLSAIDFERRVVEHNELIVRPNSLHDVLNALVWLTFPKTKRAISEAHVALGVTTDGKTRPRRRDMLTLFDEAGIIILSENDKLRTLNQQHQWRNLFITHRSDFIQQTRAIVFGHGAMEQLGSKLPQVHRGLTAKAIWLPMPVTITVSDLDDTLAAHIKSGERLGESERVTPMPLLGLPGWFAENESPACYDDESVFRPKRSLHSNAPERPQRPKASAV
jgi:Protein of unknown function (DUF3025)